MLAKRHSLKPEVATEAQGSFETGADHCMFINCQADTRPTSLYVERVRNPSKKTLTRQIKPLQPS